MVLRRTGLPMFATLIGLQVVTVAVGVAYFIISRDPQMDHKGTHRESRKGYCRLSFEALDVSTSH
jgi:hypothetical protein